MNTINEVLPIKSLLAGQKPVTLKEMSLRSQSGISNQYKYTKLHLKILKINTKEHKVQHKRKI